MKKLDEIGWREEIMLPKFSKHKIKVKIDTGAQTSALHVTDVTYKVRGGVEYVYFNIHPNQESARPVVKCHARLLSKRKIKSSTGHATIRPVISTTFQLGEHIWESEVTLVNRDLMGFRMLLGRKALNKRFLVNVNKSYLFRKKRK